MWTIPRLPITAAEAFTTCVAGIREGERRDRFRAVEDDVIAADTLFQAKAETGDCADLDRAVFALTTVDMPWLYRRRMVDAAEGRKLYDRIQNLAPGRKCPLCGHGQVRTLDHHLPQHQYHALAVNPLNLVPACRDCNTTKLDRDDDTLNPYFDDIQDRWLRAKVIESPPGEPPAAEFFICFPDHWSARLRKRVESHFTVFGLAERYAIEAGPEMTGMVYALLDVWNSEQADGVRRHLVDMARGERLTAVNTWRAALFDGLAESHWYCDEGFRTGFPDLEGEEDDGWTGA